MEVALAKSAVLKSLRGVCDANNVTERVIDSSKIMYKTIRDYKSIWGMTNWLWLTQRVWGKPCVDMSGYWPRSDRMMRANQNRGRPHPILNSPTVEFLFR